MDINNITSIKSSIINRSLYTHPCNPIFFILLTEKSPEILAKHKRHVFYFRVFSFKLMYFCSINKQDTVASNIV